MHTTKRVVDLIVSGILLVLLAPLMAVLAIMIAIGSPGPGIFSQSRVGQFRRIFICYKLRTMYVDTPTAATHLTGADAVTPIGRFLRKHKLDELPQLYNVFRGDMSLVGPRPCLPDQSELISEREKRGVFRVRPGITGKAQVLGIDMSSPEQLAEADAEYARRISLVGDLGYMISTLVGRGSGDPIERSKSRVSEEKGGC